MNAARFVGRSTAPDRDLYLARLDRLTDWPAELAELAEPGSHFVVFLAMDARDASVAEIADLARKLLGQGMAYLCTWGPDSERVHDIVDQVRDEAPLSGEDVVMTTWHADEDLDDALWFSLFSAIPTDAFVETCSALLAIVVNQPELAGEVEAALSDVQTFSREVLARETDE